MTEVKQITDVSGNTSPAVKLVAMVSYAAFLLSFVYFLFFLIGDVVPVHIDNIRPSPIVEMLIVDGALVLLLAVQHTIMASTGYKAWLAGKINPVWERPLFVAVTTIIFTLILWQWRGHPLVIWQVEAAWGVSLIWVLYGLGWCVMLISTHLIDHWHLFGLRQAFNAMSVVDQEQGFVTPLFYKLVRHPMMSGMVILLWATPMMTLGHLVMSVMMTSYILAGIRFEARKLVAELGTEYEQYHRTMPALFPALKVWRK